MSPAFIYNMSNGGVGSGTYIETNMELIVENGCATQQEMPYLDSDYITWPSSSVWKHAIAYRAETATTIELSTDAGLALLKQHLANGDPAITGIDVFQNFYIYPSSTKINNNVFYDDDGSYLGGHAITIIGYDDTKAYNDGTGTQYGAFLIVNSWGTSPWGIQDDLNGNGIIETGYENGGIGWISYSYMKKLLSYGGHKYAYILTDKINYTPTTYAVVGLTHSNRSMIAGICFSTSTAAGAAEHTYFNWDRSLWVLVSTSPSTTSNECGFGGNHPIDQCVYFDLTDIDTTTVTTAVIAQLREGKNRYGSDNPNGTITYLTVEGVDGTVVRTSTQTPKSWTMYNTICEFVLEDPVPKAHITLSPPSPLQCGTENISLRIEPAFCVISTITLTCVYAHGRTTTIPLSMQNSLWVGSMVIDQGTPQGTGHFTFHAVDSFGYTGTTILEGETFVVGTGVVPSKLMVYPNPCEMRQSGYVRIGNIPSNVQNLSVRFYDITGALVRTLDTSSNMSSDGTLRIANWDGKNDHGNAVASGIYFCVVKADGYSRTAKVAIIN